MIEINKNALHHNTKIRKVDYMEKQIDLKALDAYVKDNITIMIGGFLGVGTPEKLIEYLLQSKCHNFTIIANDTAYPDKGIGKLIVNKQVGTAIVSHIGTNPETGKQMIAKEMIVDLVPQGTLAEKIRCGGVGLGGILTKTGLGTAVQNSKTIVEVSGEEYLLELPLHADIALIYATKGDKKGNLIYEGTTKNFNPIMAMAADLVVAEVAEIVEVGALSPDEIMTPHILVDFIVKGD